MSKYELDASTHFYGLKKNAKEIKNVFTKMKRIKIWLNQEGNKEYLMSCIQEGLNALDELNHNMESAQTDIGHILGHALKVKTHDTVSLRDLINKVEHNL